MKKKPLIIALGLSSTMGLAGCNSSSDSIDNTEAPATYNVTAIDGYLKNAQVWLDLNKNNQHDAGEPQAITGDGGKATLDVTGIENPELYPLIVRVIKGQTVDESTGNTVASNYTMSAPAGEQDITPLSTFVHVKLVQLIDDLGSEPSDEDIANAKIQAVEDIAGELGINEAEVLGDFIADGHEEAAFSARSIVASGSLPETTAELEAAASGTDSTFLANATTINTKIKAELDAAESDSTIDLDTIVFNQLGNADIDTDGDGVADQDDLFPNNDQEWSNFDADDEPVDAKVGDNEDLDDDNDNVPDLQDEMPFDPTESKDSDNDGLGDNTDEDDDNDSVLDDVDAFPFDGTETLDTDGDEIGNNADTDDDGDDVLDDDDAFPLDDSETIDTDDDGTGNNADTDDDDDGVPDDEDAFPLDGSETLDTDSDGTGDNADTDDDGDNVLDDIDVFPLDDSETIDTDDDGTGNNADTDDDDDGVPDGEDAFPLDGSETLDTDSDGTGDNADTDDDNDGVPDGDDLDPTDPDIGLSQNAATIAFLQSNDSLYTVWSDGGDNDDEQLVLETFTVNTGMALFKSIDQVNPDHTLTRISSDSDSDLMLTAAGWTAEIAGYTIDFSNNELVAYPTDHSEFKYSISSSLIDLAGRKISEFDLDWDAFTSETATYPADSTAALFNMTPQQDTYYLWDWQPWVHGQADGTDGSVATLEELFTTTSAGMTPLANALHAVSIGHDIAVELVTGDTADSGTANYYTLGSSTGNAQQVASSTWSQATQQGEDIINITVPQAAIDAWGERFDQDTPHMIFSVYEGQVYVGSLEKAGKLLEDDDVYILNATAKEAFIAVTDIELTPCPDSYIDNGSADDFAATISDCGGAIAITSEMVSDKNFHREKSNGETRDYSFNTDGTMTFYQDSVDRGTMQWDITDDGKLEISVDTDQQSYSLTWALTQQHEDTWALIFFEQNSYPDGSGEWISTSDVWSTILTEQAYAAPLTSCEIDDSGWNDETDQPIVFKTLQEYNTAVASCLSESGNATVFTQAMLAQGLELRAEELNNGEVEYFEHFVLNAPTAGTSNGTGTLTTEDGSATNLTWSITGEGVLQVEFIYTDDDSTEQSVVDLMTIVDSSETELSIKLFSRSSEWQGLGDEHQGEIWANVFDLILP